MSEITDAMVDAAAVAIFAQQDDLDQETARRMLFGHGYTEHWGDCIQVPITCFVCTQEEYRRIARAALDAAEALRKPEPVGIGMSDKSAP